MRISPQAHSAGIELAEQDAASIAHLTERPGVSREAFRIFYERTSRFLWGYLLRVSGRRDVADELLQESYCRFLAANLPDMDAAGSRSYLFRIATNLLRDRWRHRETQRSVHSVDAPCEDDPETRTDVRRAFALLKPRERQLLWLAHVEGFDHKEIAGLMGLGVASVRVLLFRARRGLARVLRERSRSGPKAGEAELPTGE
ncbi:MAG TPA: sigma-70 family RNA polymerase sigma factor [Candidatus Acidoferrum sp.]|nr:sigma-70 family RNA polymerase sigma factor [Candidatus Acidoferrum sp.]